LKRPDGHLGRAITQGGDINVRGRKKSEKRGTRKSLYSHWEKTGMVAPSQKHEKKTVEAAGFCGRGKIPGNEEKVGRSTG